MDEKDKYVTQDHLDARIGQVKLEIKSVEAQGEKNFLELRSMFTLIQSAFEALNGNVAKMVSNQEKTNEELSAMKVDSIKMHHRLEDVEQESAELRIQKKEYFGDVTKIVVAFISLLGIIGVPIVTFALSH